jgi:hypothetical protein
VPIEFDEKCERLSALHVTAIISLISVIAFILSRQRDLFLGHGAEFAQEYARESVGAP